MSPALDAEHSLLVGHIFDDVSGVAQGEFEFVVSHFENASNGTGQVGIAAAQVHTLSTSPQVAHQIYARYNGKSGVEENGSMEDGFIIRLADATMITAELDKILLVFALPDILFELPQVELIVEKRVMLVPLVDDASPRSPSGDGEGGGEEVVVRHVGRNLVVVHSGNHADARVVLVAVKHLLAECEKRE